MSTSEARRIDDETAFLVESFVSNFVITRSVVVRMPP